MNVIAKDFFQFQLDFARLWAEKQHIDFNEVLFKNTCLYVRLLGYSDINRPTMQNAEWVAILKNLPSDKEKQSAYIYKLYLNFEKNKKPVPPPTACFTYTYHTDQNIFELHFVNADPKGNFSKDRTALRFTELKHIFTEIKNKNHNDAKVKIGTWMLNLDAFKRFFPIEFTQQATFLETPLTQNYTHWGQFLTKEGDLKKESAIHFLHTVQCKQFDHINKYFPLPAKISFLPLPYFYRFYAIK